VLTGPWHSFHPDLLAGVPEIRQCPDYGWMAWWIGLAGDWHCPTCAKGESTCPSLSAAPPLVDEMAWRGALHGEDGGIAASRIHGTVEFPTDPFLRLGISSVTWKIPDFSCENIQKVLSSGERQVFRFVLAAESGTFPRCLSAEGAYPFCSPTFALGRRKWAHWRFILEFRGEEKVGVFLDYDDPSPVNAVFQLLVENKWPHLAPSCAFFHTFGPDSSDWGSVKLVRAPVI